VDCPREMNNVRASQLATTRPVDHDEEQVYLLAKAPHPPGGHHHVVGLDRSIARLQPRSGNKAAHFPASIAAGGATVANATRSDVNLA
jgi:hypothetical protein